MGDSQTASIRNKISDKVKKNLSDINEILSSVTKKSTIIEKSEGIAECLKVNIEEFTQDESSNVYHNLKNIHELASLMETEQLTFEVRDTKRRPRLGSDKGSTSSLTNLASFPNLDDTLTLIQDDILKEIQSSTTEIKENLDKTSDDLLTVEKLSEIKKRELVKCKNFVAFLAGLERLKDELIDIAMSDNIETKKGDEEFDIDEKVIDGLEILNKVMKMKLATIENFHSISLSPFLPYRNSTISNCHRKSQSKNLKNQNQ